MGRERIIRRYAVDYQLVEETKAFLFGDGHDREIILSDDDSKKKFISKLKPGDQIYTESGGGNERFLLGCVRKGAEVYRIPAYRVKKLKEAEGVKTIHEALAKMAIDSPEGFYPFEEMDQMIAQVAMLSRAHRIFQKKIRIPTKRRLETSFLDLALVDPVGEVDVDIFVHDKLARAIVRHGIESGDYATTTVDLVDGILMGAEEGLAIRLAKALEQVPVYKGVFKHIPGCGSAILAGSLIANIGDIRFYDSAAKLMSKAGYGHLPDGSIQRKMSGNSAMAKVIARRITDATKLDDDEIAEMIRYNISPNLKQAVWAFCDWTRAYGSKENNVWKQAYEARYAYEEDRQEEFAAKENAWERSFPKQRAMRWLGQKLLVHIWKRWQAFNAGAEYCPPDFECLRNV